LTDLQTRRAGLSASADLLVYIFGQLTTVNRLQDIDDSIGTPRITTVPNHAGDAEWYLE